MENVFFQVIHAYEAKGAKLNKERASGPLSKLLVTVLGQQGLLVRSDSLPNLKLLATTDFDGLLRGEVPTEDIFKACLREAGLTYDEQSEYIWLPDETSDEELYDSKTIRVTSPQPVYLIVSKAVKAPEKNKQLVIDSISEFGESLIELLEKYGADIDYFLGPNS